ncbi:MAG: 30S ribosomal protein S3ae [Candidatus Aenigmarchaeota archaeon]|nr:30S ribosomal protein S3ae [Candidatus Aenigmarchaeota archaeon]
MAIKKTWYNIVSPKMFGEKIIGETLSVDTKYLEGRVIEMTMAEVVGDYSRFFVKLRLRIDRIDGSNAYTEFIGHSCLTERIYRMVQRRTRRVDSITDVITKDGQQLRLKMLVVLSRRVKTSIKVAVRMKMKQMMLDRASMLTFEELVKEIINGKLQVFVREECKKIYPVSGVEIRRSEVLAATGEPVKAVAKAAAKAKRATKKTAKDAVSKPAE